MSIGYEVAVDVSQIEMGLAAFRRQVPYAVSVALNLSVRQIQDAEIAGLRGSKSKLTIRTDYLTNPRRPGGIRTDNSTKTRLVARVGTASSLGPQMVDGGGTKQQGSHLMAAPTKGPRVPEPLRGSDDLGTLLRGSGKWPKGLVRKNDRGMFLRRMGEFLGRGRGSKAVLSDVQNKDVLFQKIGPLHAAKRKYGDLPAGRMVRPKYPIQAVYVFRSDVKIAEQWPFADIVDEVLDRVWQKNCNRAMEEAILTAR